MPTNQAFPSVNEAECSWAEIGLTFNVVGGQTMPLVDCEGIKWSRKVETGQSRGASGGRVMKRTSGSETVEASATVLRAGHAMIVEGLEEAAVAAGYVRDNEVLISSVAFDIMIQHTPVGSTRIYTTKLTGCRYLGDSDDMKEGNDADKLELTLNPIKIATLSASGKWIVLR